MILILLLTVSIIPLLCVFIFRRALRITLPVFLPAIAAGIFSLIAAAVTQGILPLAQGGGRLARAYDIFVRIALTEEGFRFLFLLALSAVLKKHSRPAAVGPPLLACGLTAGFAFAALETAIFAASAADMMVLRLITAAPLHGACGIRCAMAARSLFAPVGGGETVKPRKTGGPLFYAIALHGFYDTLIVCGGLFTAAAALFAITSLISGCLTIKNENKAAAIQ
ncbi:hypothetical protein FACS1894190_16130 [Spirochaetia bacterium]|nr:hypothetical protein FACS1894190_16130 [Spirochaetia bacterium]